MTRADVTPARTRAPGRARPTVKRVVASAVPAPHRSTITGTSLLDLQRSAGNAATVALLQRAYGKLEDEIDPDATGGGPTAEGLADNELDRTRRLLDAPEYIDSLVQLQEALVAAKTIRKTSLGKRVEAPLRQSLDTYMHYVGKVTTAESALRQAMAGRNDRAIQLRTVYLARQREKLAKSLGGVRTAITKAQGAATAYRDQGAGHNLDKNYALVHPQAAIIADRLQKVATGISVVVGIAGAAVAMPHAAIVAKGVFGGAVAGGSAIAKKVLQHQDMGDEDTREQALPLVSTGNDRSDTEGSVGKVLTGLKLGAKGAAHGLEMVGVSGASAGVHAITEIGTAAGDVESPAKKLAGKLDAARNKADLGRDKVDIDELESALRS